MNIIWVSLRLFACLVILTGLFYPALITLIGRFTLEEKSRGSMAMFKGVTIGSHLIAQKFEGDEYFWPRPSAHDYNGLESGGTNLGPTSAILKKTIQERRKRLTQKHHLPDDLWVPAELLFASGSGLDPHLSPKAAHFQVHRIVKARNSPQVSTENLHNLIENHIEKPLLKFIGPSRVNVLKLNLALDNLENNKAL